VCCIGGKRCLADDPTANLLVLRGDALRRGMRLFRIILAILEFTNLSLESKWTLGQSHLHLGGMVPNGISLGRYDSLSHVSHGLRFVLVWIFSCSYFLIDTRFALLIISFAGSGTSNEFALLR
jgi:hypothetical protein